MRRTVAHPRAACPAAVPNVTAVAMTVSMAMAVSMTACTSAHSRPDAALDRAAAGYRSVERNGQRVWCREERATGVLLPRTQCLTEPQLREQDRAAARVRDRLARPEGCPLEGCGPTGQ
jgi:hypothetical protein